MIEFFKAWQRKYNSKKYPRDLYFNSISAVSAVSTPEKLADIIISMLHWKDGKVSISSDGSYSFSKTKPNVYDPDKHDEILRSKHFFDWAKVINRKDSFDINDIYILTRYFSLWNDTSIVIPSFVLHILNPFIYPLYDQHVDRAKQVLLAQEQIDKQITIDTYQEYVKFFNSICRDKTIENIKFIDEAIWSFGKWLKLFCEGKRQKDELILNNNGNQIAPSSFFTPNDSFKKRVIALITEGLAQSQAMKKASDEYGVKLTDSYYHSPATHILRWRKQGY